jgi:uncharacterized membrane protein
MMTEKAESGLNIFFILSIILKGANAILEIIGGAAVLFVSKDVVVRIVEALTRRELLQDPNDFLANYFVRAAGSLSIHYHYFVFLYLMSHGIIKLFLVINILKRKLWSYPLSIGVFSLFIVYQIYYFVRTHSVGMALLTIYDFIVIVLIWWEYKKLKKRYKNN